jgi:hypothetical protein
MILRSNVILYNFNANQSEETQLFDKEDVTLIIYTLLIVSTRCFCLSIFEGKTRTLLFKWSLQMALVYGWDEHELFHKNKFYKKALCSSLV